MVFYRLTSCLDRAAPILKFFRASLPSWQMQRCAAGTYREELVRVYDLNINTVQIGSGPRNLLLLPGAIGSALTDYHEQLLGLPTLLPDYKIVAWDPPGHGKSGARSKISPGSDMFIDDANVAVDLMQILDCGLFSVLGWNFGGTTALVMAGRFPQFVDKVVVWGTNAFFTFDELKKLDEYRSALTEDFSANVNAPLERLYGQDRYYLKWKTYVESLTRIMTAKGGDFCKTEVDCIQAPTLVLHGRYDPVVSKKHADYLIKHIKQASFYEIMEGAHDIHRSSAKDFNEVVARFLNNKN